MRTEKEVLDQILSFARTNEMVRAVILNGSRVNGNVPKDIFCDYDVVFAVTDPVYFLQSQNWIRRFGDLIMMQQNDNEGSGPERYIFLMLFSDGVRIDLSFHPVEHMAVQLADSLKVVLLDKDGTLGELAPPDESAYLTRKPSKEELEKTLNEFWWCSTNVAKGLWRDELCYVKFMFDVVVHECIIKLVAWHIGMNHNWRVNTGKAGKWFKKHLAPHLWQSLERTYAGADREEIWEALFEAGQLVRRLGIEAASILGYEYPATDDKNVTEYLRTVRNLPRNAGSFDDESDGLPGDLQEGAN